MVNIINRILNRNSMNNFLNKFLNSFSNGCISRDVDDSAFTIDVMTDIFNKYMSFNKLTDANSYIYSCVSDYEDDTWDKIDFKLDRDVYIHTAEYIQHEKYMNLCYIMNNAVFESKLIDCWVEKHGKIRTNEEAANIAADKWCELIFGDHIQDNGAMGEEHGFMACALGTYLSDRYKKYITVDIINKSHDLFYGYYLHYINHMNNISNNIYITDDLEWLEENLPDIRDGVDKKFQWSFREYNMSCDYYPTICLLLILLNAGVKKNIAESICPWKTCIYVRHYDNSVIYKSNGNGKEL